MRLNLRAFVAALLLALGSIGGRVEAGQLLLQNTSQQQITCTVDGWTIASGATFDWFVQVDPNQTYYVGQNTARPGAPVINWASCGNLTTRAMNITPAGPNGTLVLNGQQGRVLNVALYSYIPNAPGATFEALVDHVVATYQQANPQVLLSAQMNPVAQNASPTRIYSFTELPAQLAQGGFDVMEIDTLYLTALASAGLINPVQIGGDQPFPVALAASTYNGQLYGIPSWLCMDFVYARDPAVRNATTMQQMLAFLQGMPQGAPEMVGIYNGSWRLPSIYINAYVQAHGYQNIAQSMVMPPDATAIGNLVSMTATCAYNNVNNCTNGTYYNSATPGVTEQVFANQDAGADMGFSEQSFYINTYQPTPQLYATPSVWGDRPQPLLFSDTFVTSTANCPAQSQCSADATAFTTMMTGAAMKTYIVQSQDLPANSPWRTLLVATEPFYQQPAIANNPLYQQYVPVLQAGQPFPNNFTAQIQNQMKFQICQALQAQTTYTCDPGLNANAPSASPAQAPVAPDPATAPRELETVQ